MYEYRHLSPEEKKEILRIRKERGYPLHAPPHPYRDEGYYLITAANYEHKHIMASPTRRSEFEIALLEKFREINAQTDGWIIVANHYHILTWVESLDLISRQLKLLHGATSREWNLKDDKVGKRKVWYHFEDRKIRNDRHYYAALNYIHHNPVRHGFCEHANDWPWSSIHLYMEDYGKEWLVEKWNKFKPGKDFGKNWDDFG